MRVFIAVLLLCQSAHPYRLLHFDSCIREKCFAFVDDAKSWANARDYCKRHKGILAEPMNEEEYEVIEKLRISKRVWLGEINLDNAKTWKWDFSGKIIDVDGKNVPQELNAREPYNKHVVDSKMCLVLQMTNKIQLFSETCNIQHEFLCQKNGPKNQSSLVLKPKRRKKRAMIQQSPALNETNILPIMQQRTALIETNLNTSCGGNFSGNQGVIETPNFPDKYTAFLYCVYHITAPEGHNISLTFHGYDVEIVSDCTLDYCVDTRGVPTDPCQYDDFTVFENLPRDVNGTMTLLDKTCGESNDDLLVTSSTNNIYVYLKTDGYIFWTGFNASWSIIPTLTTTPTTTSTAAAVTATSALGANNDNPCTPHPCGEGSCSNGLCDFCSPNQCVGGTCLSKPSKQFDEGQFNFTCVCGKGQIGPYCKISDDPCKSNPCKNGGTCKLVEKPGKNDWICICEGKPFIGQPKDCSNVEDRRNVNYPISDKVMLAIASFPFAILGICCFAFGVYECMEIGELPDLDFAPKSSRRLTITTCDVRPKHRDEEDDSYGHPKIISDKYRDQRKKTKKSIKSNRVSKKAKSVPKDWKKPTPKRHAYGIKRKYGKGHVGLNNHVESQTELDYLNQPRERRHNILEEIVERFRASLFYRRLTGYTDNVTIELGRLELGANRTDNHKESF